MKRSSLLFTFAVILLLAGIFYLGYLHLSMSIDEAQSLEEASSHREVTEVTTVMKIAEAAESSTNEGSTGLDLSEFTLEQKVGQLFLMAFPSADQVDFAVQAQLGGFLFFAHDFQNLSADEIRERHEKLRQSFKIPPLLAVDEEGGTVNRVSIHPQLRSEAYAAPGELYRQGGINLLRTDAEDKAVFLKDLGLNLNLSPCADVSLYPGDFIYARSLGASASETADYVQNMVEIAKKNSLISALKHFPGYGNNGDSHFDVIRDERAWSDIEREDLQPFRAGIRAGVPIILVSHNIIVNFDPNWPASLSRDLHHYLREELAYSGLIMTDDLAMDGITAFGSPAELAILAIEAGNDLICSPYALEQIPAVIEAVRSGRLSEDQIDASFRRLLQLKWDYGLWD